MKGTAAAACISYGRPHSRLAKQSQVLRILLGPAVPAERLSPLLRIQAASAWNPCAWCPGFIPSAVERLVLPLHWMLLPVGGNRPGDKPACTVRTLTNALPAMLMCCLSQWQAS